MRCSPRVFLLWIAAGLLCASTGASANAAERRALLVGIDRYTAGNAADSARWTDLKGPGNDVESLRAVLVSRYGFRSENVVVLRDAEATRENILGRLQSHLVAPSKIGDVSLFFFAGHGSQIRNPASRESDGLDETIVPADSNRGAPDIRDKELRRYFNDALDRGARLVAIFDSCHSGSLTRSIWPEASARFVPIAADGVSSVSATAADPRPDPELRGAIVLSAAEAGQVAREIVDEAGRPRGAFTYALVASLLGASESEPVERLFLRTRARMLTLRRGQSPVLAGTAERRGQPLFGARADAADEGVLAAVLRVTSRGSVVLDSGIAAGVHPGSELVRVGSSAPVRLEVVSAAGLGQVTARVTAGDAADIERGDLFRLDRWAAPAAGGLRLALPSELDRDAIEASVRVLDRVRRGAPWHWIDDPNSEAVSHVIRFRDARWELSGPAGRRQDLGQTLDADSLRAALTSARTDGQQIALFASLPAPSGLASELRERAADSNGALVISDVTAAHYVLVGHMGVAGDVHAGLEYSWLRPGPSLTRSAADVDDAALPSRSDWLRLGPGDGAGTASSAKLGDLALRLAELRAWLLLDAPPDDGSFPYHLVLRNAQSGATLAGGAVFEGDEFEIVLERDAEIHRRIEQRYVYVVAVDGYGRRTLVFPARSAGNSDNRLPLATDTPPRSLRLGDVRIRIRPPYGTDTLVAVSTRDPLGDPAVLEGAPVRTRDADTLASLFAQLGRAKSDDSASVPTHWNVERLSIRSFPSP